MARKVELSKVEQEKLMRDIFKNAFNQILLGMDSIESYSVFENDTMVEISVEFKKGTHSFGKDGTVFNFPEEESNV